MHLPLSKRLLACCEFIHPGDRVADIGCDHGYLGIHLLQSGIASAVIASDVNEGPLQSAVRNAEKYGVKDKICFYLSDGVRDIPRDFNVMVCAGMGADTMVSILDAAPWLKQDSYRLVLQCQSKREMLRRYLSDSGWQITKETVLRDGKFLYTVMDVRYAPDAPKLTVGQTFFPPGMLVAPTAQTKEYYERVLFSLNRVITNASDRTDLAHIQALEELRGLSW